MRLHEHRMLFPLIIFSRKGHIKMTQTIDSRKGSSSVSPRPRRTIRRRLLRFLGIFSLSLVGLLLLGLLSQALASAVDASHSPPPGKLVDIGGYRLHINCTGTGSPTVILDAGLGGSSLDWSLVQPRVASFTHELRNEVVEELNADLVSQSGANLDSKLVRGNKNSGMENEKGRRG